MTVNTEKSNYELFFLQKKHIDINLWFGNIQLQRTISAKYLGVYFDDKLTGNNQVDHVTKKATKRFNLLKRLVGTKWGSSRKTLNTTYNMYIKPVLKNCGEVLITSNKCNKKILEEHKIKHYI